MNILALVEGENHVCCRYRIAAFRQHLETAGHRLAIRVLPKGLVGRLGMYSTVGEADAVILQRKLLSRFEVAWLRRKAKRLIFDFDDAIWQRDSHSGKGFHDAKLSVKEAKAKMDLAKYSDFARFQLTAPGVMDIEIARIYRLLDGGE